MFTLREGSPLPYIARQDAITKYSKRKTQHLTALLRLTIVKLMDFGVRQVTRAQTVPCVRQASVTKYSRRKSQHLTTKPRLTIVKLMDFASRRVTVAMTVLFVRHCGCYDAFGVKVAILHSRKVEGGCVFFPCRGAFLHESFYSQ